MMLGLTQLTRMPCADNSKAAPLAKPLIAPLEAAYIDSPKWTQYTPESDEVNTIEPLLLIFFFLTSN